MEGRSIVLEEIFKQFNASSSLILVVTILFYVVAWLYKEFKSMLEKDHQRKVAFVQRQLDLYSSTEASIAQVIHRPDDSNAIHNLYIKLGEASSYFSDNLRAVIRDFYKQGDHSILMMIGAISAPLLIIWDIRLSIVTMVVQIVLCIMLYRTKSKTLIII